jgi:hypothetical protein
MNFRSSFASLILSLCLAFSPIFGQTTNSETTSVLKKGLVVESLVAHFEAERAGIKPGDILLKWSRNGKGGDLESPFDLWFTRLEQASRGTVEVEGLRGSEKLTWRLGSDYWGIEARPNFRGALLSSYQEEKDLAQTGKLRHAVELKKRGTA